MIPQLASPSVCVIDDEEQEYRIILDALLRLGLGCVHVPGDSLEKLPPRPFKGLRLVFTDLHLGPQVGKDAASHAANVFAHVVSKDTAPIVVVIWSKYTNDPAGGGDLPPEDQPTETDLFKRALFGAIPEFEQRLVFLEMSKPKQPDRPENDEWVRNLIEMIQETLEGMDAFDALWAWESLARDAGIEVSGNLAALASSAISVQAQDNAGPSSLNERLRLLLKLLTQQQGGPDCSEATAPRHLLTVLSQLGQEALEATASESGLTGHGTWLTEILDTQSRGRCSASKLNSLILTTTARASFAAFPPGTVYEVTDGPRLMEAVGYSVEGLKRDCFEKNPDVSPAFQDFCERTKPVFIEVTPACDFHQKNRRAAMLVGGLTCPADLKNRAKSKDAFKVTPVFEDRFSDPARELVLILCSNYRLTINHSNHPDWLRPWIRLRDIMMADIRNWYSSQAARVGYLYF